MVSPLSVYEKETVLQIDFHLFCLQLWCQARAADNALNSILAHKRLRRFRFQRGKKICGIVLQHYCEDAKTAIEIDYQAVAGHSIRQREEAERQAYLNGCGIKVVRFPEEIVVQRPESVRNTILEELGN